MSKKILDIEKSQRKSDYDQIHEGVERTELGIRSVSIMYHEHSKDKLSYENIFRLKNNIYYRLSSAEMQYKIFLNELFRAEDYLLSLLKSDPKKFDGFIGGNPFFERVERELSSIFDNIIFNITSVFDYLSHIASYICQANKNKTIYWTKLARSARNRSTEIGKSQLVHTIDYLDKILIGKLYDYRSRLIHNQRDQHRFSATHIFGREEMDFKVKILVSDSLLSKKYLKVVADENSIDGNEITLTFVASWLFKKSFELIEVLLEALVNEIHSKSNFWQNLNSNQKGTNFMLGTVSKDTNTFVSVSEILYKQYKESKMKSGT